MEPSFVRNNIYLLTPGLAKNAKDWATFRAIKDKTPPERTAYLTATFDEALRGNDDDAALRFLELVLRVETDVILLPILKVNSRAGEYALTIESGNARNTAIALARSKRASVAMELCPHIDIVETAPGVPQTRNALLKEILEWCFETSDEEESKKLFHFFLKLPGLLVMEHKKLALNALQEATGSGVAPNRIRERIFDAATHSDNKQARFNANEIGQILAVAWTRNTVRNWQIGYRQYETQREGFPWFAAGLRVLSPLAFVSDEMLELMTGIANAGAEIDHEIRGLLASLREAPVREHSLQDVPRWIAPTVSMKYGKNDMHTLEITLLHRAHTPSRESSSLFILSCLRGGRTERLQVDAGWLHDQFAIEKTRIFEWLHRQGCKFTVSLNLYLYDEYAIEGNKGTDAEILFSRKEKISQ
jgi:hypothetical protein